MCAVASGVQAVVLRCLRELSKDGQLLLDIFVNFDCDLDSSNLLERLVNALVRQAQQPTQVRGVHERACVCGGGGAQAGAYLAAGSCN